MIRRPLAAAAIAVLLSGCCGSFFDELAQDQRRAESDEARRQEDLEPRRAKCRVEVASLEARPEGMGGWVAVVRIVNDTPAPIDRLDVGLRLFDAEGRPAGAVPATSLLRVEPGTSERRIEIGLRDIVPDRVPVRAEADAYAFADDVVVPGFSSGPASRRSP